MTCAPLPPVLLSLILSLLADSPPVLACLLQSTIPLSASERAATTTETTTWCVTPTQLFSPHLIDFPARDGQPADVPRPISFLFLFLQTVALNSADLAGWGGGYPSAACGQWIGISYQGKDIYAEIQGTSLLFPALAHLHTIATVAMASTCRDGSDRMEMG